jgi:hypothetical protein
MAIPYTRDNFLDFFFAGMTKYKMLELFPNENRYCFFSLRG